MRCLLLSATLVTITLAGCKTNPSTGRNQLMLISDDEATQMGVQAKPELTKEYGGEVKSPELRHYVEQVGLRLARHTEPEYKDTKWEFTTLDSDVIDAFAQIVPGFTATRNEPVKEAATRRQPMDISRAGAELGYEPRYTLVAGLTDYLAELRAAAGR